MIVIAVCGCYYVLMAEDAAQGNFGTIESLVHIRLAERRWNIKQFADVSGIPYTSARRIVNGDSSGISYELLARACRALDCQPGDLLRYSE